MAIIDKPKLSGDAGDCLAWKHPSEVLRLGAQLNAGPNQEVLVVKSGRALDLFAPGKYSLSGSTLPLLDQAIGFTTGRKTQFTAEIWYVDTQARRELPWKTTGPIAIVDPVYNLSVQTQCQGRWGGRIRDTRTFVTQAVLPLKDASPEKLLESLTDRVVKRFSELLANYFVRGKTSVGEAHTKLNELSSFIAENLRAELGQFGWELTVFQVDQLTMPEETMKQFQELVAQKREQERLAAAAQPPQNLRAFSAAPVPVSPAEGAGFYTRTPAPAPPASPPPPPIPASAPSDPVTKLKKLKLLLENGLITPEDFEVRKQKILDDL